MDLDLRDCFGQEKKLHLLEEFQKTDLDIRDHSRERERRIWRVTVYCKLLFGKDVLRFLWSQISFYGDGDYR